MNHLTTPAGLFLHNNITPSLTINSNNNMYGDQLYEKLLKTNQVRNRNRCTKRKKVKGNNNTKKK